MATGIERTIPQKPAIIPPAETANIISIGLRELVFPYTLGLITLPSIIGQIIHISAVNKNILVLITDDTSDEMTATMKPPNHGIIADIPDKIPNIK